MGSGDITKRRECAPGTHSWDLISAFGYSENNLIRECTSCRSREPIDLTQPIGIDPPASVDAPDWECAGMCHDWRNHVDKWIRIAWGTFTPHQKIILWNHFEGLAHAEEWD